MDDNNYILCGSHHKTQQRYILLQARYEETRQNLDNVRTEPEKE